jgi:2-succinyl-6-hydroxy-2,4-cyclohexadiene-1-carboxylate synthase
MTLLDVPGARLFHSDSGGDGTAVVFVHPAAATSACWGNQVEAFGAAGYRCITYDLRGWGNSHAADSNADPGVMSDDLDALVHALCREPFVLIGAAYGGFAALDFALRFPDRVRALVLATTQGGLADPEFIAVRDRAVAPPIRDLPTHLRELGPSYRAVNPAGVERWLAILDAAGHGSARRQRLAQPITLRMLEALTVPTLVLAADADLLAPPALMRLLAAHLPNATWATIADAGHSAHWERPDEWNRAVLGFLAEH